MTPAGAPPRRRPDRREDRGAYAVIFSFLLLVLLFLGALAVDIGALQARATRNQSIADLSALASGRSLGRGDIDLACRAAVETFNANTPDDVTITPAQLCDQVDQDLGATTCSGGSDPQARPTAIAGAYQLTLHYPVPDHEIADPGFGAGLLDGEPCQRLRVFVESTGPSLLASAMGVDTLHAERSATVRPSAGIIQQIPALWLLDPTGCTSLAVSGGSQVVVGSTWPDPVPGIISIDSDGTTCQQNQTTISVTGTNSLVEGIGSSGNNLPAILLHALSPDATRCETPACSLADVTDGRIRPQPESGDRPTRAPVDWSYDCRTGYPDFHGVEVADCPHADEIPPYVQLLREAVGTSGPPDATYQRWSDSHVCNPTGTVIAYGNWWIDCPGGLSIGNGADVILGAGNIVADGGIKMTGGSFRVNVDNVVAHLDRSCDRGGISAPCTGASSTNAGLVFVRSGSLDVTGGLLELHHTSLFLEDGYVKVSSGIPPQMLGPTEGPFSGLALWAEEPSNRFQISGGSGVELFGTFFTPEAAPFNLTGSSDWGQQRAQFISYQLAVSGGGRLTMAPMPSSIVTLPPTAGMLIR